MERKYPHCQKAQQETEQDLIDRILARETPSEKRERALQCPHGEKRTLCVKCAGLPDGEIEKWKLRHTSERKIRRGLRGYTGVKISGSDCVLTQRRGDAVPPNKISDWYGCLKCGSIHEVEASKDRLAACPSCNASVAPVPEPFQTAQFSLEIGTGAMAKNHAGAKPIERACRNEQQSIVVGLFADPLSRVGKGSTGFLRIPLDAPRATRADAPEWLGRRISFLQTLEKTRSERGERILAGFYIQGKTDREIAGDVGWSKDAIKKERAMLIKQGDQYFQARAAKYPPRPATDEGTKS